VCLMGGPVVELAHFISSIRLMIRFLPLIGWCHALDSGGGVVVGVGSSMSLRCALLLHTNRRMIPLAYMIRRYEERSGGYLHYALGLQSYAL
jgi:hypothetical protein